MKIFLYFTGYFGTTQCSIWKYFNTLILAFETIRMTFPKGHFLLDFTPPIWIVIKIIFVINQSQHNHFKYVYSIHFNLYLQSTRAIGRIHLPHLRIRKYFIFCKFLKTLDQKFTDKPSIKYLQIRNKWGRWIQPYRSVRNVVCTIQFYSSYGFPSCIFELLSLKSTNSYFSN